MQSFNSPFCGFAHVPILHDIQIKKHIQYISVNIAYILKSAMLYALTSKTLSAVLP